MTSLSIGLDPRQERNLKRDLKRIPGTLPRILKAAVRRTLQTARTRVGRVVREELNLKSATVNKRLKIYPPIGSGDSSGKLAIAHSTPTLASFGPKQKANGVVTVQIRKGGPRHVLQHAFMGTGKGGVQQVMTRVSRGERKLRVLRGPSPAGLFYASGKQRLVGIMGDLDDVLMKNIDSRVAYEMSKRRS